MVTERFCNKETGHLKRNKEKSKENDTESKQGGQQEPGERAQKQEEDDSMMQQRRGRVRLRHGTF